MALISMPVLKAFKKRLDPRRYNGASFLGLRGIVVKSHGGADSFSFLQAIHTAIEESRSGVLRRITEQLEIEHIQTQEALDVNPDNAWQTPESQAQVVIFQKKFWLMPI